MKIIKVILVLICLGLLVIAGFCTISLYQHSKPIPAKSINMDYPLKNGTFFIAQSGRFWSTHTTPLEKYALDITKTNTLKSWFQFRKSGLESDPSFGTPIYSPCKGIVRNVTDRFPDIQIGIPSSPNDANSIVIGCDGYDVSLIHIKKDSAGVLKGDTINIGQVIAEIGNNGHSDGPHLHIMAYRVDSKTLEKSPLPITFNGKYFYRGDSFKN